eukprot:COSAG02_NODE_1242_length_13682_cov_1219.312523_14_plen_181_part_00
MPGRRGIIGSPASSTKCGRRIRVFCARSIAAIARGFWWNCRTVRLIGNMLLTSRAASFMPRFAGASLAKSHSIGTCQYCVGRGADAAEMTMFRITSLGMSLNVGCLATSGSGSGCCSCCALRLVRFRLFHLCLLDTLEIQRGSADAFLRYVCLTCRLFRFARPSRPQPNEFISHLVSSPQ